MALPSSSLLFLLVLAPIVALAPVPSAAAAPTIAAKPVAVAAVSPSAQLATYAGAPALGKPTSVAQQPFAVAVVGRYTFVADPANRVVRLLLGNTEQVFAGNGSLSSDSGSDLTRSELKGPYAVTIGHVSFQGFQVTGFDVYIADTFAHVIRKVSVQVPPVDQPNGQLKTSISTVAGTGAFGAADPTNGKDPLQAQLNSPYGLAWDDSRSVLYIADTLNNRIRQLNVPPTYPIDQTCPTLTASSALRPPILPVTQSTISTLLVGLNHPRGLATDSNGRLFIADTYNNVVRVYDPAKHTLTVFAGTGTAGFSGDGHPAKSATLRQPSGVTVDCQGNVYIADTGNNVIREVSANGIIQTVAGTPLKPGNSGDGGPATLAQLSSPMGVALRPNGDLVIADAGNNLVRILEGTISAGPTHNIHTEAGNGTASFSGEGQPPAQAQFAGPTAVLSQLSATPANAAVPAVTGTRYVLDTFNHVVRTYTTADTDADGHTVGDADADDVATLAGLGGVAGQASAATQRPANSRFAEPMGMVLDASGRYLYVADTFNNVVRRIDLASGNAVATVAGTAGVSGYSGDGGAATSATLSFPTGLATDHAGDLFIADSYNGVIREVRAGTNRIYTVAGTGLLGFSGDGGAATRAGLYFPYGVAVDNATPPNLFISDSFDHRIREVTAVSPIDPKSGKPLDAGAKNVITTVAGDGTDAFADGSATPPAGSSTAAEFDRPWNLAFAQGNLVVADYLNQRLRQVNLSAGMVSTIAGGALPGLLNSSGGPTPDSGPALTGQLNGPRSVSLLGDSGALLVADSFNNRVRWYGNTQAGIQRTQVNFDPTNLAGTSQAQSVTVTSSGSGLLVMGSVDLGQDANNFFLDPTKNTCANARLEPGSTCFFQVAFQPRSPGSHNGSVLIPNDAVGGQQTVLLTGQATAALVTLSPPAVAMYQPLDGSASPAVVTLRNNGNGPLTIDSIALQSGTSSAFGQSNNCPSVMLPNATCQITITLDQISTNPPDLNIRSDWLVVKDDAAGNPITTQTVPLTGSLSQPAALVDHTELAFAQNIGTNAAPQTFQLVNSGQVPLQLSEIRADGDFSQTNNCPPVLAPGAGCAINVIFQPSTLGQRDGYIVVVDNSADSPQRIAVTGVATIPSAHLNAGRLTFTSNVGAATPAQFVNLVNTGNGPLTIGAITTTGDFRASPECPAVLLPSISCSIGVSFTPKASGARSGSLLVTDDSNSLPGSQQTILLNGIAHQPVASLSSTAVSAASNLGGSVEQGVTITNTGDGVLTIRGVGISGRGSGDWTQSNNCPRTLQPGAACIVGLTFTPHGYGARDATLTLTDDGAGGAQSVALNGLGTAPRALLSNSYLNFGGDAVGNASVPQSIIVFNAGNGPLSIDAINLSGSAYVMNASCGSTLAAGASCRITVTFVPKGSGPAAGLVTIEDSVGTQRFTLSGVGT